MVRLKCCLTSYIKTNNPVWIFCYFIKTTIAMKYLFLMPVIMVSMNLSAQDKPYYYQIPETPSTYTAANVAARLVDGLGFRFFWASQGLTQKDLEFKPSKDARTTLETIEHINGLTTVLLNAVNKRPTGVATSEKLSFAELREKILMNIKTASDILKKNDANLEDFDMIFDRPTGKQEYPFWNLVNGPIADALWHIGQVVTFRRSSGNPLPEGVNVLRGTKTE